MIYEDCKNKGMERNSFQIARKIRYVYCIVCCMVYQCLVGKNEGKEGQAFILTILKLYFEY